MNIWPTDLCKLDVTVSSQNSLELADGLLRGRVDLAFLRREPGFADLTYRTVTHEPLVVISPSDHVLATQQEIAVQELSGETFIGVSKNASSLQLVIDAYLRDAGLDIQQVHSAENLAMAMSLVASTRGVALLPAYAQNFLP